MAGLQEVHSFVSKFITLCNNGKQANLAMRCKGGRAVINLQLHLAEPFHDYPQPSHHPHPSPSRVRRSARRAHARAANAERANSTEQVAASHSFNNIAEKATPNNVNNEVLKSEFVDHATDRNRNKLPAEQAAPTSIAHPKIKQSVTPSKTVELKNDEKSEKTFPVDELAAIVETCGPPPSTSSSSPATPACAHHGSPPSKLLGTSAYTHTPPGLPLPSSPSNPTIDDIKAAIRKVSEGVNSMADRVSNRFDETCNLPSIAIDILSLPDNVNHEIP